MEESTYELNVYLGDSFIEERSQGNICIRDFRDKKIYRSSKGKDGFASCSLFSDIGFRVYEFQNRMMLSSILEKSGIEENPMDRVLTEHLFSLTSDKQTNLKREKKKNRVTFTHNNKALLRYSHESTSVTEAVRDGFLLFLRYRYGIHPQILDELGKSDGISKEIVIYRHNIGTEKIRLNLLSVDSSTNQPRKKTEPVVIPEDDLVYKLATKVAGSSKEDYSKACASLKKKAVENAEAGNNLDAITLFVGYTLATGKQMPPEFLEFKDEITKDADVQLLFASLSPQSKEAAVRAAIDLKTLSEKSKDGISSILIFQANILDSLEKQTEAIDSFLAALSKEPMIVGAWKDLGDIYYNNYDAEKAWLCWDTGRSLLRGHKLFQKVNQLEETLLADHPEFFMKGIEPANPKPSKKPDETK